MNWFTQLFDISKTAASPAQARRDRLTLILLMTIAAGPIVTMFSALFLGGFGQWQYYVIMLVSLIVLVGMGISIQRVRRGLYRRAATSSIGTILVASFLLTLAVGGIGIPLTLIVSLIGFFLSMQLLSGRDLTLGIVITLVGSWLTSLVDLFFRQYQLQAGGLTNYFIVIIPLLVVGFIVLLLTILRSISINAKLIVTFLIVALVPVSLLLYYFTQYSRTTLTENANETLTSASEQVANTLDTLITNKLTEVQVQALNPVFVKYLSLPVSERAANEDGQTEQEVNTLLDSFLLADTIHISSYALLDSRGVDVADTFKADVGIDKKDRDYFQETVKSGLPYISAVEISQTADVTGIYFAAPVHNQQGRVIGVVRVRYDASIFQEALVKSNGLAGAQSFPILLDEYGIRLAHGTRPDLNFKLLVPLDQQITAELIAARRLPDLPTDQIATNLLDWKTKLDNSDQEPIFTTTLLAVPNDYAVLAVTNLKTKPWKLAYTQPESVLYALVNTVTRNVTFATLFISALVTMFALLIANQISRPIGGLTQTAHTIAAGDFSAQANVETGDEIGELAGAFNTMTSRLQQSFEQLERRSREITTVAEVSRRLSVATDPRQLAVDVVEQVQSAFHYYHAHMYFVDEQTGDLVMAGGTGEVGAQLLARGHKVQKGRGLVGRAAETNRPVLVPDVTKEAGWLRNPLLPDTKSEIAIPISTGQTVLGVLDVQQNEVNGLTEQDVNLLQSLTGQVAISLQNARNLDASRAKAELEANINVIGQKIQRAATVEETLETAIREMGLALGASRVAIHVSSPKGTGGSNNDHS